METFDAQARLFRTLMHPARLAILNVLRDGEACVCHIEAALGYRQAYISQQLMVLRDAGLAHGRREGLNIFYHVADPRVFAVLDAAWQMTGQSAPAARRPKARACPCPKCHPHINSDEAALERRLSC